MSIIAPIVAAPPLAPPLVPAVRYLVSDDPSSTVRGFGKQLLIDASHVYTLASPPPPSLPEYPALFKSDCAIWTSAEMSEMANMFATVPGRDVEAERERERAGGGKVKKARGKAVARDREWYEGPLRSVTGIKRQSAMRNQKAVDDTNAVSARDEDERNTISNHAAIVAIAHVCISLIHCRCDYIVV